MIAEFWQSYKTALKWLLPVPSHSTSVADRSNTGQDCSHAHSMNALLLHILSSCPPYSLIALLPSWGMNVVNSFRNKVKISCHAWKNLLKSSKQQFKLLKQWFSLSISLPCFCCSTICERSSPCTPSLLLFFFLSLSSFALCALPLSPSSFPLHTVVCRHAGIWASKW